jgi:tetratricopeptide (TPR) repeat protein
MNKWQWIVVGGAVALFFILYFGCETKPKDIKTLEKSRVLAAESTDISALLKEAKSSLEPVEASNVLALERQLELIQSDTAKSEAFKDLSSKWYQLEHPAIAGYYAQQVAEIENTEESWSITGTTYSICIQRSQEEKIRAFCTGRALRAFENAISIDPEDMTHQVNLALAYTYNPPQENPMKGILMLRELNEKAPEDVLVMNTLARLAIRTGQYDKAVSRLERSFSLEPQNRTTACLLAQAYEGLGNSTKAEEYSEQCRQLSNPN